MRPFAYSRAATLDDALQAVREPGTAVLAGGVFSVLPALGAATLFALVIAGQVLAAVTLDHFGAFGLTPHPISAARVAGAALLIAGVILIRD